MLSFMVYFGQVIRFIHFNNIKEFLNKRINFPLLIILFFLFASLIAIFIFTKGIGVTKKQGLDINTQNASSKLELPSARSTFDLHKEFFFPLKNSSGLEIGKFKYSVETAELRDQIILNGQKVETIRGKVFLILNIKLGNDLKDAIKINTRDFARLSLNGNDKERIAPDVHNDPVEIQALSTKLTRIGFSINDTDKKLKLFIGTLDGDKTELNLDFP